MDELLDPIGDRVMKSVPMIAAKPLTPKELWKTSGNKKVPNIEKLRKHLLREGHLEKEDLMELISEATKILSK